MGEQLRTPDGMTRTQVWILTGEILHEVPEAYLRELCRLLVQRFGDRTAPPLSRPRVELPTGWRVIR